MIPNNTYKSVRLLGDGYNLYYSVWCNNEHELYDLSVGQTPCMAESRTNTKQTDPYQLHNLYTESALSHSEPRLFGRPLSQVVARLDALLLVLKSCQGATCIEPWKVLQPEESVHSLRDALAEEYDPFYSQQPRVSFDWCAEGYVIDAEGPQAPGAPLTSRYGVSWDHWV